MAKDSLRIEISATLREAVGFQGEANQLDYFTLLGVERDCTDASRLDKALIERTKSLRKWQNSPKFGAEAVRLLNQLHRAVKILKDSNRCQLYRDELTREERGERASPTDRFADLVRAALADSQIDTGTRQRLAEFAAREGVSSAEAQQIINRIRAEMEQRRAAERAGQPPQEEGWEFRIAVEGEEGFQMMLSGMEASGEVSEEALQRLLQDASRYQLDALRAGKLISEFQQHRFKKMVERVAGGRIINEDQARVLVMKARSYGIDELKAYEIISDYTLSAYTAEEGLRALEVTPTFTQDDIADIIDSGAGGESRSSLWRRLNSWVPSAIRNAVLGVMAVGVVLLGILYLKDVVFSGGSRAVPIGTTANGGELPPVETPTAPETEGTPVETPPPTTPAATPRQLVSQPDPVTGMLLFEPMAPGDPPAFEIGIAEVTNEQYQQYVRSTLDQAPSVWPEGQLAPDRAQWPVTGITWNQAIAYCQWYAALRQLPVDSLRLPTFEEYLRALRGDTLRGDPTQAGYWQRARLYAAGAAQPVKTTPWDRIYIPSSAQMYDLIGNVAEWGMDQRDSRRLIFGGDFELKDPGFNHLAPRWRDPANSYPTVGFRLLRVVGP